MVMPIQFNCVFISREQNAIIPFLSLKYIIIWKKYWHKIDASEELKYGIDKSG